MVESQEQQIDDQPIIYEEDQVIWAKIRGYPWWPAFVDKVHGANSKNPQQIEYTVFFFGDATHSRLAASKLRRFFEYYTEFYPKAKTHRKLNNSIRDAELKLQQNGSNIEIYEALRNSMKKQKKGRARNRTDSKISSEDHAHNLNSQISQMGKLKSHKSKEDKSFQQHFSQQPSHSIDKVPQKTRRSRQKVEKKQEEKKEKTQSKQKDQKNSQPIYQPQPPRMANRTRSRRGIREVTYQQPLEQDVSNEESESQDNRRSYPLRTGKIKPINKSVNKRRGRPRKTVEEIKEKSQMDSQSEQKLSQSVSQQERQKQTQRVTRRPPRERGTVQSQKNKQTSSKVELSNSKEIKGEMKAQQQQENPLKDLIMQRVKFCLNKREELIQYLSEANITVDIIQEVLDLDVVKIIKDGEITLEANQVLNKLKSTLLFKYFPADIKIKKNYQKISKKLHSKMTSAENQETLEDLQLRRKTIIKLEKILRVVTTQKDFQHQQDQKGNHQKDLKQKAIQIEAYFRSFDESIGEGYKKMAYNVLRTLKDKLSSLDEVLGKLENGDFEEKF